jgi:hypothetical protein
MLEVGVYKGGSLNMWSEYLYPDSIIVGIDIDPSCQRFEDTAKNVYVRIGSQADPEFLHRVTSEFGPFDVVLDDGSHVASHMITTFQHMFDSVKNGGVYIVEDIHASYWLSHRDGRASFIDFINHLVDAMHAHYQVIGDDSELREGHPQRRDTVKVPRVTTYLNRIDLYDSIAIFHRGARDLPRCIHN